MSPVVGSAILELRGDASHFRRVFRNADRQFQTVTGRMGRNVSNLTGLAGRLTRRLAVMGTAFTGLGVLAVREFTKFETALTGVAKTTDLTQAQLTALGMEFRGLSERIPVAANDLLGIAEAAGQLGIRSENIRSFTETIAALGVSTNLSFNEAATALARFANVAGIAQTDFDRVGAAVVDLGNNLAVTESEIVHTQEFFAGIAKSAGIAASEILGIAGAIRSAGVRSEAGGSGIMVTIQEMQKAVEGTTDTLGDFAEVAGMTAERFATTFRRDAAGALTAFVEGLGDMIDRGESVNEVLDTISLQDRRVTRTLIQLASAGDLLRRSITLGTNAWRENTALTVEAERFYNRVGARFTTLRNKAINVAAAIGQHLSPVFEALGGVASTLLDRLRDLGPEIGRLAQQVAANIPAIATGFVNALGTIGLKITEFVQKIQSSPIFSGTSAAGGLIGYIFLGPLGLAAGVTIGSIIDGLMSKLGRAAGGGSLTVFDALAKQQERLLNFRKQLERMRERGTDTINGMPIEEAIANVDRQLVMVGRSIRTVEQEFGTLGDTAADFFAAMQQFEFGPIGGLGGGERTAPPAVPGLTGVADPRVELANSLDAALLRLTGRMEAVDEGGSDLASGGLLRVRDGLEKTRQAAMTLEFGFTALFDGLVSRTISFAEAIRNMASVFIHEVGRMLARAAALEIIGAILAPNPFTLATVGVSALGAIPGFAHGGFIGPNQLGIVGERGPELVQAGPQGATVTPNAGLQPQPTPVYLPPMPRSDPRDANTQTYIMRILDGLEEAGAIEIRRR